ncbi:hypothetical protein [Clostridium sp.]|uniref:hypothetical protein n=1 Tax=Clostridium sp. TaxID=1506 RepID=UPI00257C7EB9|nr:hypothetical protein [Clostridium sp.]MBD9274923.1 hypothetical protein [Clostridium sp.]
MTVLDFVSNYEQLTSPELKEKFLKGNLNVKSYLPVTQKIFLAEKICDSSMWDKDKKYIEVNSPVRAILTARAIISAYTDLTGTTESWCDEYDALSRSGLMREIMSRIPELELAEFHSFLNMTYHDVITNFTEPHNFISHKVNELKEVLTRIFEPLVSRIKAYIDEADASEDDADNADVAE